jgi:hypothetical protein
MQAPLGRAIAPSAAAQLRDDLKRDRSRTSAVPHRQAYFIEMSFDGNALLLSLVIGCVGFVCFAYGKRQGRFPQMLAGVTLMVYPYVVSNLIVMGAIAVAVLALLGLAIRMGA